MNDYLLVYQNGDPNWRQGKTPEQLQQAMVAWTEWFKRLEASGHLRNPGAALLPGGAVLTKNGQGFHTDTSMSEVKELIGGYSVVQAESAEEAAKLAEGSPFLKNNPQGQIIIRPVMKM